ncbi:MAG: hypothetical protein A3H96_01285 [Acidobacteria bacterium RIFCSPLOWO2_02_FULL_67_36]|nr:MAG: hypothetical protein A3H96_01285 [Acidobacteria bacterium RIFCSPLOWO2_02_FULL_67_36]OFW18683.1 MAG: hypothetical protein A3G21_25765 [Acidobacteria bacterium RIFCSPLOWO2_12_FULL_66_21]
MHQPAALAAAIKTVLDKLTPRPRRCALVVPDLVAKVSLLRFEKIPPKLQDLDQLIRWQMRKAVPFKIEEAQVGWVPGIVPPDGGREFVVTAARRDIIESYERACEAAGAQAGIVDIASLNLINSVLAAPGAAPAGDASRASGASGVTPTNDWLLVHVGPGYGTLAVVRGRELIFFRNRSTTADDDLADLVHQTTMYHEDRLGGGRLARVVLAGASSRGAEGAERLRRDLEERIGGPVETLDFRAAAALRDRIAAGPGLIDSLAPAVGVLLRERVA